MARRQDGHRRRRAQHPRDRLPPPGDGQSYRELGSDYFDRLNTECLTRYHTKRLAALGYTLTLAKHAA
jgi:hypothetical protein